MVIDVRQRNEYLSGHIAGALNIELGELQTTWTDCPGSCPSLRCAPPGPVHPPPGAYYGATGETTFRWWWRVARRHGLNGLPVQYRRRLVRSSP